MTETKKRKAVYNPEADKKWREKNKEHSRYLAGRTAARSFIRNRATPEDIAELQMLMQTRLEQLKNEQE